MANINFPNSRLYSGHYFPVLVDFNFIVDSTNGNGLGIRSLKGAYVQNVFMHTTVSITGNTHSNTTIDNISTTVNLVVGMGLSGSGIPVGTTIVAIPNSTSITISAAATATASGVSIVTSAPGSPNPAAGLILVKLKTNFNRFLYANIGDASPTSGSNVAIDATNLTIGQAYIITSLGTSTAADWAAIGVPLGLTPSVGLSFIATATGAGSGSGQVQLALATGSGIAKYDVIGDANQSIAPQAIGYSTANFGSWLLFRALAATNSSTTTFVATAPANGSVIGIQCVLSNSSLTLGGQ